MLRSRYDFGLVLSMGQVPATLLVLSEHALDDPAGMHAAMRAERPDILSGTPSVFARLFFGAPAWRIRPSALAFERGSDNSKVQRPR
jgi:hypothetical protein